MAGEFFVPAVCTLHEDAETVPTLRIGMPLVILQILACSAALTFSRGLDTEAVMIT